MCVLRLTLPTPSERVLKPAPFQVLSLGEDLDEANRQLFQMSLKQKTQRMRFAGFPIRFTID
jgi:hypothetical protein